LYASKEKTKFGLYATFELFLCLISNNNSPNLPIMSFTNDNINKVAASNSTLFLGIFGVAIAASALAFFSHKLTYRLINLLNSTLGSLASKTEKRLNRIMKLSLNQEQATRLHARSKRSLNKFKKFYNKLEKADFFDNATTLENADAVLLNFYNIETHLRFAAKRNLPKNQDDQSLLDFASDISLGSLQA
jgi:hypothetical protein